jgi:BirA family biotin operon repressor/biotin-[acetyl-CoA-carboxylase] ligase
VADSQTAGRGRGGRSWSSLQGNLFLTLVLKPNIPFSKNSSHLSMTHYMGVRLCLFLEKLGLKPAIKWPNDVQVEKKKIAGILAESVPMPMGRLGIVLGVGVNLNMRESDLEAIDQPAISLLQLLPPNKRLSRDRFLNLFLQFFFEQYDLFLKKGFSIIASTYDSFLVYKGERVRLQTEHSVTFGTIKGVGPDGALYLVGDDNKLREYYVGDVWLEKA